MAAQKKRSGRQLALLISNSDYQDEKLARLETPDSDVAALNAVLSDPAIGRFTTVHTLDNADQAAVRPAISRFLSRKRRDDLLVVYFTGHGVRDENGELYLAVADTDVDDLYGTALRAEWLSGAIDRSLSRRIVLILDCCHAGAFARGAKSATGASVGTAAAFEGSGYGRVVLTASDATQYAWQGSELHGHGGRSVFTHYLVEGMQTGQAAAPDQEFITVSGLAMYVHRRVTEHSAENRLQTPGFWSYKLEGDLYIARNPAYQPVQRNLPPWLYQAIADPNPIARLRVVDLIAMQLSYEDQATVSEAIALLMTLHDSDPDAAVRKAAGAALNLPVPGAAPPDKQTQTAPRKKRETAVAEPSTTPELALTLVPDKAQVAVNKTVRWVLTIRNVGKGPADDVVVRRGKRRVPVEPFTVAAGAEQQIEFNARYRRAGTRDEVVHVAVEGAVSAETSVMASVQVSDPATIAQLETRATSFQTRTSAELLRQLNLTVKLSVKPKRVSPGQRAEWSVYVRNDETQPVRDIKLRRGKRPLTKTPFDLASGKSRRFTFFATYQQLGMQDELLTVSGKRSGAKDPVVYALAAHVAVCGVSREDVVAFSKVVEDDRYTYCPRCDTRLMTKNLVAHWDKRHPAPRRSRTKPRTTLQSQKKAAPQPASAASQARAQIKQVAASAERDAFVACPICGVDVKARNLVRHFDRQHAGSAALTPRDYAKQLARTTDPDAMVTCPTCGVAVKGKSLLRHYDRQHGAP